MDIRQRLAVYGVTGVLAASAALIGTHEGEVRRTYLDPIGIPTYCFGQTGPGATPGKTFTAQECTAALARSVRAAESALQKCTGRLPDGPRIAFTSLTYNVGSTAVCKSNAARLLRSGDYTGACSELSKWVYAGGKKLPGLVRRRAEEKAVCLKGLHEYS